MIRKLVTLFLFFLASASLTHGQVKVFAGASMQSLIQTLQGPGVQISNIYSYAPYLGNPSYGAFNDATKSIGLSSGVILTTGAAIYANGPNNSPSKTQVNGSNFQDPDLQSLVGQGYVLRDLCSVEFDIITSSSLLTFNYVLASEEYNEYTDYNDVLGFFISGPGIVGKKNLAVIPGTNTPVSVSNINLNSNSNYYINNDYYNYKTQYDGYTVPLTASIKVQPCTRYHIKLAIEDARDAKYDSGVFIEKGSFKTENPPTLEIAYQFPNLNYGVEGCNNAQLIINRNQASDLNTNVTYTLNTSGSAISGVDYSALPTSITIPAGSQDTVINITVFKDSILDGTKKATISIPSDVCPKVFPNLASTTLIIQDKFDYAIPSQTICPGKTVELNNNPVNGQSVQWDSTYKLSCYYCKSPIASPDSATYYKFTIIDDKSQCKANDSVLIKILFITADFNFGFDNCYTTQDIEFTNNTKNANNYTWDFGDGTTSNEVSPLHFYDVGSKNLPLKYTVRLTATSDYPSCIADTSKTVEISEAIFIPNLMTPNNDRHNEHFKINGIGVECWTLYIYNNWGGLIYKKENYNDDFDAKDVEDGTYFYLIENGPKNRKYKGWLQIVR